MEALIQKRIRTKEPFAWKNEAHRYDARILSASSASAAASGAASSASHSAVDELMRYVTYQAGEKAGTPAPERRKFAPSKTNSTQGDKTGTNNVATPGLLFESILNLFADAKEELYVKDIVQKAMGKVNPADVPPEMSSAHLVLAALSFLSAPMPSLDQSSEGGHDESEGMKLLHDTFPQLPLLENVSGLSTKITWRTYKLACAEWKGLDSDEALGRKVRNLEAAFLMSTVAFPTRYCLTPRLSSTEEEREVLRTGFVPASMDVLSVSTGVMPSNSRPNTPTPTSSSKKKKKKDGKTAQSTAAASTTSASAVLAATPAKSPILTVPPVSSAAVVPTPLDASALPIIATGPKRKASGDDRSSSADAEPPTKKVAKKVDANAQDAGATR